MISIVIPTYNNLDYLKLCLNSIKKNSFKDHEVLLHINDGSDGSLKYAIDNNITINGLVILNEEPFLGGYFERGVIGGHGAFMMVAEDYRDYAAMILQKLLREIGLPVI